MWTKVAPVEHGYYWYRCDNISTGKKDIDIIQCNTYMTGITFECVNWQGDYTTKEMLLHNGEFWSERIVEPEG